MALDLLKLSSTTSSGTLAAAGATDTILAAADNEFGALINFAWCGRLVSTGPHVQLEVDDVIWLRSNGVSFDVAGGPFVVPAGAKVEMVSVDPGSASTVGYYSLTWRKL